MTPAEALAEIDLELVKLRALPPERYARSARIVEAVKRIAIEAARWDRRAVGPNTYREGYLDVADFLTAALESEQ